jgi:hypothetical protein
MAQVKDKSATNLVKDNFYPIVAIIVILVGVFLVIKFPSTDNKTENTSETTSSAIDSASSKPKNLAHRGQEFWALYVNGKQSEVGAGVYVTKNDDVIEWRLEEIKAQ